MKSGFVESPDFLNYHLENELTSLQTAKSPSLVKGSWEVKTSVLRTNRMKGGVRVYIAARYNR